MRDGLWSCTVTQPATSNNPIIRHPENEEAWYQSIRATPGWNKYSTCWFIKILDSPISHPYRRQALTLCNFCACTVCVFFAAWRSNGLFLQPKCQKSNLSDRAFAGCTLLPLISSIVTKFYKLFAMPKVTRHDDAWS